MTKSSIRPPFLAHCPTSLYSLLLSLVEFKAFRLVRIFQPMRALEFIKGHVFYNPAYNKISQTKETMDKLFLEHAKNLC